MFPKQFFFFFSMFILQHPRIKSLIWRNVGFAKNMESPRDVILELYSVCLLFPLPFLYASPSSPPVRSQLNFSIDRELRLWLKFSFFFFFFFCYLFLLSLLLSNFNNSFHQSFVTFLLYWWLIFLIFSDLNIFLLFQERPSYPNQIWAILLSFI